MFKAKNVKTTIAGASAAAILALGIIQPWEGRRLVPYKDIGGIWTVCDGITGPDVIVGKTYTHAECDALGLKHLYIAEKAVDKAIAPAVVPDLTKAAFISFTYNVGASAFEKSTLVKMVKAGDLVGACNQLSRWVYVKKTRIKGLVNRRLSEQAACLEGLGVKEGGDLWW